MSNMIQSHILVVDGNRASRENNIKLLSKDGICFLEAENYENAQEILLEKSEDLDLILVNCAEKFDEGMSFCGWIRRQSPLEKISITAVIPDERDETLLETYGNGVDACVSAATNPMVFVHIVNKLVEKIQERKKFTSQFLDYEFKARHDGLTGLLNHETQRREAERYLEEEPETDYCMIIFDLDNFKNINDTRGHDFGNKVLIKAADQAERLAGENGYAARIGGDEFLIFVPFTEDIYIIGNRVQKALRFELDGIEVTASVGLVSSTYVGRKYSDMFLSADFALYSSKRNGRDRYTVYIEQKEKNHKTRITKNEFELIQNEKLPGGFFSYSANEEETLLQVNEKLIEIFGCESETEFRLMVGNSFQGIVHPDDLHRVKNSIDLQINRENGAFDYIEYRIIKKDGTIVWVEDHGRFVHTEEDGDVYYVFVKEIESSQRNRQRILIIDDQKLNREMLSDILSEAYIVEEASGGEEAIAILDNRINQFDLVILDLIMPKVDGFAVLEHMNRYKEIFCVPVIVISADTHTGSIGKAYNLGAIDVINRPYNAGQILKRIRNSIELFWHEENVESSGVRKKKILIAEGGELNKFFLSKILSGKYEVILAGNEQQAKEMIHQLHDVLSLIIIDLHMPEINGYELMDWMQRRKITGKIPILVETVPGINEEDLHALYSGASDYISKPYRLEMIRKRVANVITSFERAQLLAKMKYDSLTGALTKEYFEYALTDLLENSEGESFDIIWSNICGYKLLSDRFGAETGDKILRVIADIFREDQEVVLMSRYAADHFFIVVKHREDGIENRIMEWSRQIQNRKDIPYFNMNFGVYKKVDPSLNARQICNRAVIAGKDFRKGDSCISYYDEEKKEQLLRIQKMTLRMNQALLDERFIVHFQPKYSLVSGKIIGAEALVRWLDPEDGYIMPGEFIPLFESNGYIKKLDRYVLEEVCKNLQQWKREKRRIVPVSVNISARDFEDPEFMNKSMELFEQYEIDPSWIHMEITESSFIADLEGIIQQVEMARENGSKIELDDFGTGYSSFSMITDVPMDIIKLDIGFVRDIHQKKIVVEAIINLAHKCGYRVVAEGVEKEDQIQILKELSCDFVQGYYYSRPVPKEEMEKMLEEDYDA